jgi:hypothetical protein
MKLCECGCGKPVHPAPRNKPKIGWVKGEPIRFIAHHHPNQWAKQTVESRFWSHVDKHGPLLRPKLGRCWQWTGGAQARGRYGAIYVDGKLQSAHRVAWFFETGEWPDPNACHKCDNTLCVRFSHLFEGTPKDNAIDREQKGRGSGPYGRRKPKRT